MKFHCIYLKTASFLCIIIRNGTSHTVLFPVMMLICMIMDDTVVDGRRQRPYQQTFPIKPTTSITERRSYSSTSTGGTIIQKHDMLSPSAIPVVSSISSPSSPSSASSTIRDSEGLSPTIDQSQHMNDNNIWDQWSQQYNNNDDDGDDYEMDGMESLFILDDNDRDVYPRTTSNGNNDDVHSTEWDQIPLPPLRTPIVYRYYPRQKTRTITAGSVPFILIGPNVDHWKIVAQQLSSRGFNVIAVCPKDEMISSTSSSLSDQSSSTSSSSSSSLDRYVEGPTLIVQLLDALKWKRAVLVGCDSESTMAIQATIYLASQQRVAGLILCGNLQDCETIFVRNTQTTTYKSNNGNAYPILGIDTFLQEHIICPYTIIWDGTSDMQSSDDVPLASITSGYHRTMIIGGGSAPHRRRPGIFAWILTRFVEDKLAPTISISNIGSTTNHYTPRSRRQQQQQTNKDTIQPSSIIPVWLSSLPIWKYPTRIPVLWNVDDMFNEESMVVFGRIVATAIFYAISLKVILYQYGNVRNVIDFIISTHQNMASTIQQYACNIFSIILSVRHIPSVIFLPFRKNHARIVNQSNATYDDDDSVDNVTDYDEEMESETLQPMFFLDHVVA